MSGYRLGLYEKAMPAQLTIPEKLALTKASGFDQMELSIDETDAKLARLDCTEAQLHRISDAIQDIGVPIRTMCLSGHRKYPMGSHDACTRKQSMWIVEQAVNLAARLGIRVIQLAGYDVYYEEGDEQTAGFFLENLNRAVGIAAEQGVLLGFETMETPFMDTVQKAMRYVDAVCSPFLGVYPDIGNLKNASIIYGKTVPEDLKTGRGHIWAAHLKETLPGQYRDINFGEGYTDYRSCIRELISQGVRLFTAECWDHGETDYRQRLLCTSSFLREKFEEVTVS